MFNLLTTKQAFLDAQGNPLSGGRLWTKVSGSNTNKATTRDVDGAVPNTNPIILDSRGEVPFGVFGTTGAYRLILAAPGDLTDPPSSPIWGPRDGVSGINDIGSISSPEWSPTGMTPTFTGTTTFTVTGDQTATFQVRRRVRATVGAGFRYGTISATTFITNTGVTLSLDSAAAPLDASLSAVAVGNVSATDTSQPYDSARGTDLASAGTITFPANADRFNITGTTTITAFAGGWIGRRVYLTHAGAQLLTNSSTFVLPGPFNFTTEDAAESIWEQTTLTAWKMINYMDPVSSQSVKTLDREATTVLVSNTTSEITIADLSVPAGTLGLSRVCTWRLQGNVLKNAVATLTFRVKFGGATVYESLFTLTSDAIRRAFLFEFSIAAKNSASVQSGFGVASFSNAIAPSVGIGTSGTVGDSNSNPIATSNTDLTVNTAIAQTFEITAQWSAASASAELARKFAICTLY